MQSNFPSEIEKSVKRSTETSAKKQTLTREQSASYAYEQPNLGMMGEAKCMECPDWKGNKW